MKNIKTLVLGAILGSIITLAVTPKETITVTETETIYPPFMDVIESENLSTEMLENRKHDRIIVERVVGTVVSDNGNGYCSWGEGGYISYNSVDFPIHIGMEIETYFVYNPETNYLDDFVRYDYPLN